MRAIGTLLILLFFSCQILHAETVDLALQKADAAAEDESVDNVEDALVSLLVDHQEAIHILGRLMENLLNGAVANEALFPVWEYESGDHESFTKLLNLQKKRIAQLFKLYKGVKVLQDTIKEIEPKELEAPRITKYHETVSFFKGAPVKVKAESAREVIFE